MKNHPAIATLPRAMRELVLELEGFDLPVETRSTCGACAVAAPGGQQSLDRPFHQDARCCTYHPNLPGFLVGRALARGGPGRERVLARLEDPEGLSPSGIAETSVWNRPRRADWFGRDPDQMCPYWVGGELACGIWEDRDSVCRTWYCRYLDGNRSYEAWQALNRLLRIIELRLGWFLLQVGEPPTAMTPEALVPWFRWCAERVDAMSAVELAELIDAKVYDRIASVEERLAEVGPPLPEVVTPSVAQLEREHGRVWLVGFSILSGVWAPPSVFEFLSRLDGERPWREALAQSNALAEVPLTEELVHELWSNQIVSVPDPSEVRPGMNLTRFAIDGVSLLDEPLLLDVLPFSLKDEPMG